MVQRRQPYIPRLLIVAADSDLRRSLEFALRAEGYEVTSQSNASGARAVDRPYECTVVDHHAFAGSLEAGVAFCRAFVPVILLANQTQHPLSPWAFRTMLKPLLGAALSDAVRDAVQAGVDPT
jgi:DNA-binding NtrC family response regulator